MARFEKCSTYYRILVEETGEEQVFGSEKQALAWAAKVVWTLNDASIHFTLTRVRESSRVFVLDREGHENRKPARSEAGQN